MEYTMLWLWQRNFPWDKTIEQNNNALEMFCRLKYCSFGYYLFEIIYRPFL